jgi:hypothetical protein
MACHLTCPHTSSSFALAFSIAMHRNALRKSDRFVSNDRNAGPDPESEDATAVLCHLDCETLRQKKSRSPLSVPLPGSL